MGDPSPITGFTPYNGYGLPNNNRANKPEEVQPSVASELSTPSQGMSLKPLAMRVVFTALAVITSPLLLVSAGVIAASHLICKPKYSLWNRLISTCLLPASRLTIPPDSDTWMQEAGFIKVDKIPSTDESKLDACVLWAAGLAPEVASKMPTVVIFNPNYALMEDRGAEALEYQRMGVNVVLFNYRGVGKSEGKVLKAQDMVDDGLSVVEKIINEGIDVKGVKLRTEPENILLDGHSIGGGVAIAVGAQHPAVRVAADRTFTRWTDAAEGVVSKYSNALFGKLVKAIFGRSVSARLDNVVNMQTRLVNQSHRWTLIESAKGAPGSKDEREDGVLSVQAKLDPQIFKVIQEGSVLEHSAYSRESIDHGGMTLLDDRPLLKMEIEKMASESGYKVLSILAGIRNGNIETLKGVENRDRNLRIFLNLVLTKLTSPDVIGLPIIQQEINTFGKFLQANGFVHSYKLLQELKKS